MSQHIAAECTAELLPGTPVCWYAVVSNYGHVQAVRAVVVRCTPQRVRIETRYNDGKPERQVSVKRENLRCVVGPGAPPA